MTGDWPWDQPRNCATMTERAIIEDGAPILLVAHDLNDHGWQFLGGGPWIAANAMIVCLSRIPELDPAVIELADLPPGWMAWRKSKGAPWTREPDPSSGDDDDGE